MTEPKLSLFLDSGAFSALTQNVEINIDEYIQFIKDHQDIVHVYSVLDDIEDPEKTLKNQKYMESAGLSPIPCYHYNEPIQYLRHYRDNYDYLSLGGLVGGTTKKLKKWLNKCWMELVDKDNMPVCKVHAFGMTSHQLMFKYPWYSVDSTAWVITARMGSVYIPRKKMGKWDYSVNSWKVTFSNKSPDIKVEGKHFNSFGPIEQEEIMEYVNYRGYAIGESDFKVVEDSKKYNLEENERWFGKANGTDKRMVEVIVEPGLLNSYKMRDEMNVMYFMDLEDSFPEWPFPWENKPKMGFEELEGF